jgi:hypothetical protein
MTQENPKAEDELFTGVLISQVVLVQLLDRAGIISKQESHLQNSSGERDFSF